jgi:hypothetical protein
VPTVLDLEPAAHHALQDVEISEVAGDREAGLLGDLQHILAVFF